MLFLFLSILSHIAYLFLIAKSLSSTAASVGARGSYIEVKTDMRKMLYEAPKRVLPNPSDAPVILVISNWRVTITTTIILSLKNNNTEKLIPQCSRIYATGPNVSINRSLK